MSNPITTSLTCEAVPFDIYYKGLTTQISGDDVESLTQNLFKSIAWLRQSPDKEISGEEKLLISSSYQALAHRLKLPKDFKFLSLSHFLPESSPIKPRRIGLEAEYAHAVHAKTIPMNLKYNQRVGSILTSGAENKKILAQIKLDGITSDTKTALLELECRPFSIDSKEFSQQLQIIDSLRKALLGVKEGSSVQDLLETFGKESNDYEILVNKENPLVFGSPSKQIGPFCQVTVELPLSRLGDPTDQTILDLIEIPRERELLQHARLAADALVKFIRPTAAKLHGDLYEMNSIKLAKLRGYFAQSIMQTCQVIEHNRTKERVGFHIRAAGPYRLGLRDKELMKIFFDWGNKTAESANFEETLKQALKKGLTLLNPDHPQLDRTNLYVHSLMNDSSYFDPTMFQFKSGEGYGSTIPEGLEFAYGMTLVELRSVRSPLNKGIIEQSAEAYSRIKNAQALPESRPKKILLEE